MLFKAFRSQKGLLLQINRPLYWCFVLYNCTALFLDTLFLVDRIWVFFQYLVYIIVVV